MSIVVITIPDPVKQEFVRQLQAKTGAVSLVIVQGRPPRAWYQRWYDTLRPAHIFYTLLLRVRPVYRTALSWFRGIPTDPPLQADWAAPTIWTNNINDSATKKAIFDLSPRVLAIWGSGLIDQDTIDAATHTTNLHLGFAPYYRGALANQFAIGRGDIERVGFTIHDVNGRADAGDIIMTHTATIHPDPRQTFSELNRTARSSFVDSITSLYNEEVIPRQTQDVSVGHVSRMRDWTPQRRYQLARRLLAWRATGRAPTTPLPSFTEPS